MKRIWRISPSSGKESHIPEARNFIENISSMAGLDPLFVESHVHLDRIYAEATERIAWIKQVRCLPISWAFGENINSVSDLRGYLHVKRRTLYQINTSGLPCFYLAGIHPRNIPSDLKPEAVTDILTPYLDDPLCLGIGEIGLETASGQEREMLFAQLNMAPEVTQGGEVFGVHTPRDDKIRVTDEIVSVLEVFLSYRNNIVVDHCTLDTITKILELGFWAGVTLSSIKTSLEDLHQIIKDNSGHTDRIILSTDSGNIFYEDLHRFSLSEDYPDKIRAQLVKENALTFYQQALWSGI